MKYLKIQNKGELDIRLLFLMGGTTKSKDAFKIGQWGSGLKYTLAWLVKNNLSFKVFIGEKEVVINTESERIRDEDFDIICIDGVRTSITTQMGGAAWEPWMIIRELWCNALDEGEELREETTETIGQEGSTTFYIQITPDIREVISNWTNYFIHDQTPMSDFGSHRIYQGTDAVRLYKQGVLIYEDKTAKSLFSYDIRDAEINELREFNGTPSYPMVQALSNASDKVIKYYLENVSEEYYEGTMSYEWWFKFNIRWKENIGKAKIIHQKAIDEIQARGMDVDSAQFIVVPEKVYKFLTKEFDGIGALRIANKVHEFYEIYSEELELKIKKGLAILESCNYFIHPDLRFIYGVFGDKTTLAQIKIDEKLIMVSEQMLDRPLFQVVGMIVEENEHFNTGLSDCTREFQQHFINKYVAGMLKHNQVEL